MRKGPELLGKKENSTLYLTGGILLGLTLPGELETEYYLSF